VPFVVDIFGAYKIFPSFDDFAFCKFMKILNPSNELMIK
jgi:hypothetical protein